MPGAEAAPARSARTEIGATVPAGAKAVPARSAMPAGGEVRVVAAGTHAAAHPLKAALA